MTDPGRYGLLPVAELCGRCHEETARFLRGVVHDDGICFEVFRRAIYDDDGDCWEHLERIYGEQVKSWCRAAHNNAAADHDELAAVAWERFWRSFKADRLSQASGTPAVLAYLRACAWSAAVDYARTRGTALSLDETVPTESGVGRSIGEQLLDHDPTPPEEIEAAEARSELWQVVDDHLKNEAERVLMHLSLEIGLKPREIQTQRPDLFPDIKEVYTMTRNVFDRLRRSPEFRRWYDGRTS